MASLLTKADLATMRKAGKIAAKILKDLKRFIKPGICTKDIETFFERKLIQYSDMEVAFKGFMGYPASCCVSVNEEIIHGIPSKRRIQEGDLVSVDLGIKYKGLFVDTAYTYILPKASVLAKRLVKATFESLYEGISRVKPGNTIGDIGSAVQSFIEKKGFSIIRRFVGHGIGRSLHQSPEVPNFGKKGQGANLEEMQVLAIEPMTSAGSHEVNILSDGWTAKTKDNSLSAHFEHTVAITKRGHWILTE